MLLQIRRKCTPFLNLSYFSLIQPWPNLWRELTLYKKYQSILAIHVFYNFTTIETLWLCFCGRTEFWKMAFDKLPTWCNIASVTKGSPYFVNSPNSWWRHQMEAFPCNWSFMRGIQWSPVNSPHKGQWCGDLMSSLICTWTIDWVNNRDAGDLRRHRAHHDVIVMFF